MKIALVSAGLFFAFVVMPLFIARFMAVGGGDRDE